MKGQNLLLLLLLLTMFISCKKNLANFTEAQPINGQNFDEFPKKVLGNYKNLETETLLKIEKYYVIKSYQTNDTINGTEFSKITASEKDFFTQISDSLFIGKYQILDTILNIKNNDILRKYKGNYYLNKNIENGLWNVSKLIVKNKFVILSEINDESDLKLLDEISDNYNDSIYPKTYNLNKSQFKEFVKKNGFSQEQTYIKE